MWLDKLERKIGKYAIPNLSLYMVITLVAGWILSQFDAVYSLIDFDPHLIMSGQVWRLITGILIYPSSENILFFAITLLFYYSLSRTLENTWGAFRFNVYVFGGMILTIVGSMFTYFIMYLTVKATGNIEGVLGFALGTDTVENICATYGQDILSYWGNNHSQLFQLLGESFGGYVSIYYILMSILLAFAATYPDLQVMLYFIIPLKIKYLGIVYFGLLLYEMIGCSWVGRIVILMSILNFIIFFVSTRNHMRVSPKQIKRRHEFNQTVRRATEKTTYENGARHKCAICGRTELDDPNLTFRFCSKCTGGKEYCNEHLFTHMHK